MFYQINGLGSLQILFLIVPVIRVEIYRHRIRPITNVVSKPVIVFKRLLSHEHQK